VGAKAPARRTPRSTEQVTPLRLLTPLRRRLLALLLPMLALCTGALVPTIADIVKLHQREPTIRWPQLLNGAAFAGALESMVAIPIGLLLGLMLMVLTRDRDLAQSAALLLGRLADGLRKHNRTAAGGAAVYAGAAGIALFVAAGYKVIHVAFTTFKNRQLAALLLALATIGLGLVCALCAAVLRVWLLRLLTVVRRVPVLRMLGSALGAATVVLLGVAGGVVYLVFTYRPIVRLIDWRPLSYPSVAFGAGAVVLAFVLWLRARRLRHARPAGSGRHAALAVWGLALLGLWTYCFMAFEKFPALRTTLLRRSYGAARSFDIVSWALDFDNDGYLSFFGGGDCAPFDPAVHPGAPEIPGNGIDDNCYGGDLSPDKMHAPPRRFDQPLPPSLAGQRPNIVFITLDGLRADHVGAYGYTRPTTPNVDHLAKQAVIFERALTQAPSTRYSIPSFMTSKYFSQVPRKGGDEIPEPILPEALMMAEVLKQAGYRTGAALSYQVFERSWHLDQGFDVYDNTQAAYYVGKGMPSWNKDQPYVLVDVARKFLATTKPDKPFFLWTHFFEPHPPNVHRTKPRDFGADPIGQYDGELIFVDEKVGELLKAVQALPSAKRTIIVISSDHGREFGEHGAASHGYDVYVQSLHVPLIVYVPGVTPRRIKNPVALLDLLPTFVNFAGSRAAYSFEGETLVPQLVKGVEPNPERPIFSEVQVGFHDSHVINSITTRDFKLIYDVTFNTYQLFDTRTDPSERTDVSEKRPADAQRMKNLLHQVMERATLPGILEEIHSNILAAAPATPGIKQVNFGNQIEFLGFEVRPERPRAGAILTVSWYLKALTRPKLDYKFIVQLKGSRGAVFDAKHVPVRGQYPATKWSAGQIIRDQQHMRLPPEPQEWEVWVGFGTGHETLRVVPPAPMVNTAVLVGKFSTI
jgi:arylsulfatase A-like enzyme